MLEEQKKEELTEEEVNVYAAGCGDLRYICLHDCMPLGNAMLSSAN